MCNLSQGIYDKGIAKGISLGKVEGKTEGENLMAKLIEKLLSVGRTEDIGKVATDPEYRKKLYAEFGLE